MLKCSARMPPTHGVGEGGLLLRGIDEGGGNLRDRIFKVQKKAPDAKMLLPSALTII